MAASLLAAIQDLLGIEKKPSNPEEAKLLKEKKKQKLERIHINEVVKRQEELEKKEINQQWRIAMGNELPKKKKDTFLLKEVTRRNVWMEAGFLFDQVKKQFPDEFFHPIDQYVLKWQPPGSNFQSLIPLNDSFLQENAIIVMSHFLKKQQDMIVFLFTTIDPTMNLFAPKVHPASLVSYHAKNDVLKKLSDFYLQGHLTTDEIQAILMCDVDVWKPALYNLLPADEQVFHGYLNEVKRDEVEDKPIHKSYMDGEITLSEYSDLKFPDRKKKRDVEAQEYPLQFDGLDCVICGALKAGVINCHTCENMVCVRCIHTVFHGLQLGEDPVESDEDESSDKDGELEEEKTEESRNQDKKLKMLNKLKKKQQSVKIAKQKSRELEKPSSTPQQRQSFLLMHHKYCMKLGALPDVFPEVVGEVAFLREFRMRTRRAAIERLLPVYEEDFDDPNLYIEEDDEEKEKRQKEELRLQKLREEAEAAKRRLEMENPPELKEKRQLFEDRKKRFEKIRKEILLLNTKILDTSHTEQFIARNNRLRNEEIARMENSVVKPLMILTKELQEMDIPGDFLPQLKCDITDILNAIESVCSPEVPQPNQEESGRKESVTSSVVSQTSQQNKS